MDKINFTAPTVRARFLGIAKPEILWIIKIVSKFTRPARPSLFFFVVVKGNGTSLCSNKEMVSHKKRQS